MEGDDILATMDSLWFYTSVLQPPSKHKQSDCAEELQPGQKQDSAETHKTDSGSSSQPSKRVEEAPVAMATDPRAAPERRAAVRSCRDREWDERMVVWQKEQRRLALVAAAARCSQPRMPPPGEGVAMKAHLRSWAHAVACSVR